MRLLITAGPTREYIDSVRFISNPSSGKFGYAIAATAAARGHSVVLVTGPVELPPPSGITVRNVVSAEEMLKESEAAFAECDVAIMAAAVCDYRPAGRGMQKQPKNDRPLTLDLVATPDICERLGRTKRSRVVIGFAMEDHNHRSHAEFKLQRKHCDAIILNSVSTAGADSAEIEILRADSGWQPSRRGAKQVVALAIVELAEDLAGSPPKRAN